MIHRYLKLFLVLYPLFVLVDFSWYGLMMSTLYQPYLGHLMRAESNLTIEMALTILAALALLVICALLFVTPHVEEASSQESLVWGALYGLGTYGVYSLSGYAYFEGWPFFITLIDGVWGSTIMALFALLLSYLAKNVFPR